MRKLALAACAAVSAFSISGVQAAVSYSTVGSTYSQDFDGLGTSMPSNASIETLYPGPNNANDDDGGWIDDMDTATAASQGNLSILGWYLDHRIDPSGSTEDGFNNHQRVRAGAGANTGSFWLFGAAASNAEKALGDVGSASVASDGDSLRIGLRLTNNTGFTLTSFTVTYDGEEWRDGQSATAETMNFSYMSAGTTAANWHTANASPNPATFVNALGFTAPVFAGTGSSGTALDGNAPANRRANISATINFNWAPGTDLWLRWSDPQLASLADDGLAIDNVRFSATPEPTSIALLGLGAVGLLGRRRVR